jgi:acetyl esterase/lipase
LREILKRRPPSLTPDMILTDRKRIAAARLSNQEIEHEGRFTLQSFVLDAHRGDVSLLVARPSGTRTPVAFAYNMHGGGMIAGHNRSPELIGELDRAHELGMAVVSINYRLAPEHPDPTPVEDCYAGLLWTVAEAAELGLDADRVILTGASAGGALAAGVAMMARDRGGPPLLGQMLLCPMTDDRVATPSAAQMDGRGLWDATSNVTAWTALLGTRRGTEAVSPYAAPARATNLAGLPPAFIDVGAAEALRDEAIDYAARLSRAGVHAELHVWGGAFHSFDEWVPEARVSKTARAARVDWLARLLAAPPASPRPTP